MRGVQIKNLLEVFDNTILSNKTSVEKADLLFEFFISQKVKVDKLITRAKDINESQKFTHAQFIDQLELQKEIDWSITLVDYYLKHGPSDFLVVPNDQHSVSDRESMERVYQLIMALIEN